MKPETCTEWKECRYSVCKRVPKTCEKDCHYTVCCPVYEQHCHVACHQVQKQLAEQHVKECCHTVCRPVTETCHKTVCCQVQKCIAEQHMRECCHTVCREVCETRQKDCVKKVRRAVTVNKCVVKKCGEWVEEQYTKPGRCTTKWVETCECCFDPCTCKQVCRRKRCPVPCVEPPQVCTRKVWREKCVTELVPCVTYVEDCVIEKVPYVVKRKVVEHCIKKVPYTVHRMVRGAYVDSVGVAHECDGPDRKFQECAVVKKQVPYTVTRMVTEVCKKQVPYTVTRCVRGAYVDDKGQAHAQAGPGRDFREGAVIRSTYTTTSCRMVPKQMTKKVQYTVWETVSEECVKKVPVQVCRMVPTTMTKQVPHMVTETQKVCQKVAYTECYKQAYTVRCKVPYTVCENVPCCVTKKVQVCVPETVCVKRARLVPVQVECCPDPVCPPACPTPAPVCCETKPACCPTTNCCETNCGCRESLRCRLSRLRQRWFSSLCCNTTSCCEPCCRESCREGLLRRLFRNRLCCEPVCCDSGCAPAAPVATAPAGAAPVEAVPAPLPKAKKN
jgi:hypothetical protein